MVLGVLCSFATVNQENVSKILFSGYALKDIFATLKLATMACFTYSISVTTK